MREDWLELLADYDTAYELERTREVERAGRIQKVIIMVPKRKKG